MNDHVKQLAEQAGFVLWANEEWKPEGQVVDWSSNYDVELEKFAELIVRECADVCELIGSVPYSGVAYEYAECAKEIRRHFGVE